MEYTFTNAPTSDGHTQYKANVKQPGATAPQPLTYEQVRTHDMARRSPAVHVKMSPTLLEGLLGQAVLELKKEEQGGPLTIAMTQLLANSPYPAVVMELPCATKVKPLAVPCPGPSSGYHYHHMLRSTCCCRRRYCCCCCCFP